MRPDEYKSGPDEVVIEVDGDGVHLDTLDAPATLEFAVSYFRLLQKIVDERGEEIEFKGLKAIEKCGLIATRASDPVLAQQAAVDAHRMMSSPAPPPHGLRMAITRVREARAGLPSHYLAKVKILGFSRPIDAEPFSRLEAKPYATTSVRAYLSRIGGSTPQATFKSKAELRAFSLVLRDDAQAKELSPHLYTTLDIVALVARNADGAIEEGRLLEFYPLTGDPRVAWAEWFRENGIKSEDELKQMEEGDDRGDGSP